MYSWNCVTNNGVVTVTNAARSPTRRLRGVFPIPCCVEKTQNRDEDRVAQNCDPEVGATENRIKNTSVTQYMSGVIPDIALR